MDATKIFPKRYWASDKHGWADMPEPARKIWMRIRPAGLTWYAVDFTIVNKDCVKLYVYDMLDNVYGGIGKVIHTVEVTEFTDSERAVLDERIEALKWAAAERELERQLEAERRKQVQVIKDQLFGVKL